MLTHDSNRNVLSRNAWELKAEAEEHHAKAAEYDARAANERALAHRKLAEANRCLPPPNASVDAPAHVAVGAYATSRSISKATVHRLIADGMPTIPVGTTVRIDPVAADEWRRQRPRKPTTPERREPTAKADDVDVSDLLAAGGLRAIAGGRHR